MVSLKERWNFSWAEMGTIDIPAIVDKIIEVTGQEKVTLMGYSQGSSQMYYGLAKRQDFFADRVHRFVALASCIQRRVYGTYEQEVTNFLRF